MRKYILGAMCGVLLTLGSTAFADTRLKEIKAYLWPTPIKMNVNGEITTSNPDEVEVLNYNDKAYVPLRYVAEKLGATVTYKIDPTDLHQYNKEMITIDSADDRNLKVKDADGIFALGNFQFTSKPNGILLTFQIKQNADLPSDKPFLNLSFYDGHNKHLYTQAVTLSSYVLQKSGVQTLNIQLDTVMPTVDFSKVTAALSKEAVLTKFPGSLTPLPNKATYILQPVMTDTQHGWAEGDGKVLRTKDGGKTWLVVTPPELLLYSVGSSIANHEYAFVGNHAWVAKPPMSYNQEMEATVWHTANGGQTWIRSPLPFKEKWEPSSHMKINFRDENNGFIFVISNSFLEDNKQSLYTTSDGGNHWTRVMDIQGLDHYPTDFIFLNSQNGWLVTIDNKLMHTINGGRTWNPVPIKPPGSVLHSNLYLDKAPQFFGTNHQDGILNVDISTSNTSLAVLYSTHDGGKSWNISGEAPVSYPINVQIIDDKVAYALRAIYGNNHKYQLYLSTNGGHSWTLKNEFDIPTAQAINSDWRFLNLSDGWISDGYPGNVYETHDGGKTWTQLRSSSMNDTE